MVCTCPQPSLPIPSNCASRAFQFDWFPWSIPHTCPCRFLPSFLRIFPKHHCKAILRNETATDDIYSTGTHDFYTTCQYCTLTLWWHVNLEALPTASVLIFFHGLTQTKNGQYLVWMHLPPAIATQWEGSSSKAIASVLKTNVFPALTFLLGPNRVHDKTDFANTSSSFQWLTELQSPWPH